jgi:hypothetical protein
MSDLSQILVVLRLGSKGRNRNPIPLTSSAVTILRLKAIKRL